MARPDPASAQYKGVWIDEVNNRVGLYYGSGGACDPVRGLSFDGTTISTPGPVTVDSGTLTVTAGDLSFTAASDIRIAAATAASLEISDGTTKFYAVDTRVTTIAVTTHAFDISDYTLASGSTAVATGLSLAAHTLTYTGCTQVTTQVDTVVLGARTIAAGCATTVDEANTLTVVAPTEGSCVTLTDASGLRVLTAGGTPTNNYGIYVEDQTGGATADYGLFLAGADTAAIWVNSADPIHLGVAGASTGKMEWAGATSGVVTMTVAAAAGTWTFTLPPDDGCAGEQLQTNGSGVTTWETAGSHSSKKNIIGELNTAEAFQKILDVPLYEWTYKEGNGLGCFEKHYVGPMLEDAPWYVHHVHPEAKWNSGHVDPITPGGMLMASIKELNRKIERLEERVAA